MVRKGPHLLSLLLPLLLLVFLEQLSASQDNECPRKQEATKEAAMEAFKVLYGDPPSPPSMPRQEVIKNLEIFEPFFWHSDFAELHKHPVLGQLSCLKPSKELCVDKDQIDRLRSAQKFLQVSKKSRVLSDLLEDFFRHQLQLCRKEWRKKEEVFRDIWPEGWSHITDLGRLYKKRKIADSIEPKEISSTSMMAELLDNKLAKDQRRSERVKDGARNLVAKFEDACQHFESHLGPIVQIVSQFYQDMDLKWLAFSFNELTVWQGCRNACQHMKYANKVEAIDRVVESRAAAKFKTDHAEEMLLISEVEHIFRNLPSDERGGRGKLAVKGLLKKGPPKERPKMSKRDLFKAVNRACKKFLTEMGAILGRASEVKESRRQLLDYEEFCKEFCDEFVADLKQSPVVRAAKKCVGC